MKRNEVFVFGSNKSGRHGKGAALYARQHYGAIYGQGVGSQGRSYAIPTKDHNLRTLPLKEIDKYVQEFLDYADEQLKLGSDVIFKVTAIGCGLAGYTPEDIAPMFSDVPSNVRLPEEFTQVLQTLFPPRKK